LSWFFYGYLHRRLNENSFIKDKGLHFFLIFIQLPQTPFCTLLQAQFSAKGSAHGSAQGAIGKNTIDHQPPDEYQK
jgi:hypothetical protein